MPGLITLWYSEVAWSFPSSSLLVSYACGHGCWWKVEWSWRRYVSNREYHLARTQGSRILSLSSCVCFGNGTHVLFRWYSDWKVCRHDRHHGSQDPSDTHECLLVSDTANWWFCYILHLSKNIWHICVLAAIEVPSRSYERGRVVSNWAQRYRRRPLCQSLAINLSYYRVNTTVYPTCHFSDTLAATMYFPSYVSKTHPYVDTDTESS